MATRNDAEPQRKFITFAGLAKRWECVRMTVENRMRKDPNFPRAYVLPGGRIRLFDLADVERYERAAVVERKAAARPKHERERDARVAANEAA